MFSRFYRPPALGLPFCARLGKRKYRSEARMIFFQPTQPLKGAALHNQPGKRLSLQQEMKKQTSDSLF